MENVVNLEQLNYRDQLIKEYIDNKIQPSPEPVPVKAKEHVVDYTFRKRKWVKYQNVILFSSKDQEEMAWFEVGNMKFDEGLLINDDNQYIESDLPDWFNPNINYPSILIQWRSLGKEGSKTKMYTILNIAEQSGNKLKINLYETLGEQTISQIRVYSRRNIEEFEEETPYILRYLPSGPKREFINNTDVIVNHNKHTMHIRVGYVYKGEFDRSMCIRDTKGFSKKEHSKKYIAKALKYLLNNNQLGQYANDFTGCFFYSDVSGNRSKRKPEGGFINNNFVYRQIIQGYQICGSRMKHNRFFLYLPFGEVTKEITKFDCPQKCINRIRDTYMSKPIDLHFGDYYRMRGYEIYAVPAGEDPQGNKNYHFKFRPIKKDIKITSRRHKNGWFYKE